MKWRIVFTSQAKRDARNVEAGGQRERVEELLALIAVDPFVASPPFEKLRGELAGAYSRRINRQHRLVYQVFPNERTIKVLRMWTHYE